MDVATAARVMGRFHRVEDALFTVVARWAADSRDDRLTEHLAVQAQRHGWHAELWEARLPALVAATVPPAATPTEAADTALAGLLDTFGAVGPEPLDRLVAIYRVVVPRLAVAYRSLLASTDPLTDGPTTRLLTLAARDEEDAWHEGERWVQSLVVDAATAAQAAGVQARLEGLLAGADVFAG